MIPRTKKLVWRGRASKTLDTKAKPEKQQKNLQKAMAKLLKNFPPKPKTLGRPEQEPAPSRRRTVTSQRRMTGLFCRFCGLERIFMSHISRKFFFASASSAPFGSCLCGPKTIASSLSIWAAASRRR